MRFRETPWGQQSPPPWKFDGTQLRGFALPASLPNLQAWCDDMLNGVGESSFVPAFPIAFVYVVHYPKMVVIGYENLGFTTQNEFFVMIPVIRLFDGVVPIEVGWAFPFIGVDNATSAISGQMVIGLAKTFGTIKIDEHPGGNFEADVSMFAVAEPSKTSQQQNRPLLAIDATDANLDPTEIVGGFPGNVLASPQIRAAFPPDAVDLLNLPDALASDLGGVCYGLRQVRDCGAPTEAAISDIVWLHWESTNARDFRTWGSVTLDIFDNATFPITERLGLIGGAERAGGGYRFAPIASWGSTADLTMSARVIP